MNDNLKRLIVVVVVFLLVIFGFIWVIRKITNLENQTSEINKTQLVDYANSDTAMRMVISGKIVSNEDHNEVHITVSRTRRTLEIVRGYENRIVRSHSFGNNESAYYAFLSALESAGYTKVRRTGNEIIPEGACSTGQRFWYQIVKNSEPIQSLWSTSCSGIKGTFGGSNNAVQWLFKNQIPNYDDRIDNVDL